MRIDFTLTDGTKSYLSYSSFSVGPAFSNYQLSISGYKGIAPSDPFSTHPLNGMPFTTKDKENDIWSKNYTLNDAGGNASGWWYKDCSRIFLNNKLKSSHGIYLGGWKAVIFTDMKIRPVNC